MRVALQVTGHLSAMPGDAAVHATRQVDITNLVISGGGGASGTLLVFRPLRHPQSGDIPAGDLASAFGVFHSAEAADMALRPSLTIQYR